MTPESLEKLMTPAESVIDIKGNEISKENETDSEEDNIKL
jgi:hypothetical protein